MPKPRWLLALPLAFAAWALPATASEVRDDGAIFSPEAVRQAQAELDRIQRETKVPVIIETIPSLKHVVSEEEYAKWRSKEPKEVVNLVAQRNAREGSRKGLYILIDKQEHVISNLEIPEKYAGKLPESKRLAVRTAFVEEFKNKKFDAGLSRAVKVIGDELRAAQPAAARAANAPVANVPATKLPGGNLPAPANKGGGLLMSLIPIVLVILAILIGVRILGALFRGPRAGYGGPGRMGGPGYGGGGPGYGGGGPGYGGGGGGGGGFFSSMFGGIGGALAGNWLYDQFSGRHGQDHAGTYGGTADPSLGAGADVGGGDMIGAGDDGGQGTSWGGADTGGDWGGGAADAGGGGGGGDWGGGGDAGGGGGDWGGGGGDTGGGGGDWGGGGGDGGGGGGGDW